MAGDEKPGFGPESNPVTWVERFGDELFHYALTRLRDRNAAEEVVQETFLAGVRHLDQFRGEGTEEHWLKGILRRKIVDFVRRESRQDQQIENLRLTIRAELHFGNTEEDKETMIPLAADPPKFVDNRKLWVQLKACLEQIPQRQADVFVMRYLEGIDPSEIVDTLEISDANYWVLLHRARAKLAECLQRKWSEGNIPRPE